MKKRGGPTRIPHFRETLFIFKLSAPRTPPLSSRFGAGGVTRPRPPEDVSSYANSLKLTYMPPWAVDREFEQSRYIVRGIFAAAAPP